MYSNIKKWILRQDADHRGNRLGEDLFQQTLQINLSGAFYATQAAAKQMSQQSPQGGSIIAISSISALVGGAGQTHYTPTKAGVLSLMQSCACALGKYNIRCNALLPGTIKTQLNEKDLEDEEKKKYMEGRIPLGRTGVTEDLAGPAVFLGSDMSRYVVRMFYHVPRSQDANNVTERRSITRRRRTFRQPAITAKRTIEESSITNLPTPQCSTLIS